MTGQGRRYVPADVKAQAVAAYLAGESSTTVAARFGVCSLSVRNWVDAAGYERRCSLWPGYPEAVRVQAVALYADGMSASAVARTVGLKSLVTVLNWARDAGVEIRTRGAALSDRRRQPSSS